MKNSYSTVKDFQVCKSRYFHKQIAKDVPFEKTAAIEWGNYVHDAFAERLKHRRELPGDIAGYEPFCLAIEQSAALPRMNLLVEQSLAVRLDGSPCGFFDEDVFWRGKADVVLCNDESALFFDWKTGGVREDPWELRVQSLLLVAKYPQIKTLKGRYVWLKRSAVGAMHNLTDVHTTWREMQSIETQIEKSKKSNFWPTTENPLCAYCPVLKCEYNRTAVPTVVS